MKSKQELEANFEIKEDAQGFVRLTIFRFENEPQDSKNGLEIVLNTIVDMVNKKGAPKKILLLFPRDDEDKPFLRQSKKRITNFLMREVDLDKIAILGLQTAVEEVLSFLVKFVASGLEIKWFPKEEEAVKWLQQEDV